MPRRYSEGLLPEFDQEAKQTRQFLVRIPEALMDWTPHVKSMSIGQLEAHLAEIPRWLTTILRTDRSELGDLERPIEGGASRARRAQLLEGFDRNAGEARVALEGTTDEAMMANWTLVRDGEPIFSLPRLGVVRGMVLNHLVHHRGQLSVYLRLLNISVPAVYGPSADEGFLG